VMPLIGRLRRRHDFPTTAGRSASFDSISEYYIDLTAKAGLESADDAFIKRARLHVVKCQWGLGCYDRFLAGEGEEWLQAALGMGRHLLKEQEPSGPLAGAWRHAHPLPHTYELPSGWISAMAQGEGASLLVRLYLATMDESFAEGALRALGVLNRSVRDGGVRTELRGGPFLEEYPTDPPSYVLNGAIFAAWGYYDVAHGLGQTDMQTQFDAVTATLADNLDLWDVGYWSRYDLFPHRAVNIAAPWYHSLHVEQLRVLEAMTGRSEIAVVRDRWVQYYRSPLKRTRALLQKTAFRVAVPKGHSAP
jgi:heparosan-N-sulfate-glucuronate 5-epimerase